jgi:hypothetical protein
MALTYYRYSLKRGVQKIKTRTAIVLSVIGLALGGGTGLTMLAFSTAHAAPGLAAPTLLSPTNNSVVNGSVLTNTWSAVPGADHYVYTSYNDAGLTSVRFTHSYTNTSKTATNVAPTTFWWRVRAVDAANNAGAWSPAWKVTVSNSAPCVAVYTSKGALTTAKLGGTVSGDVDATGCDIGAYFSTSHPGSVDNAQIHDANQYGVLVDGLEAGSTTVNVTDSHVYNIGHHTGADFTPNGSQTGVGVYYDGYHTTGTVAGSVIGNTVDNYQKAGVVTNGAKAAVSVNNNTVTGLADVPYIAQDGIQFGYGAQGTARGNTIDGNWYTGAGWTSTGMLLFDVKANQVKVSNNKYLDNQTNHSTVEYSACPHMYGGFYEDYGLCES